MSWPTHSDYQDAIQNPNICFAEEELKAGAAASDMLGLPRVMSGNFASVYEISTAGKRYAVRCFVRQVMGQQGRYQRLCQHLGSVKLPWLVAFDYFLKGILVRGEWYPIVKMTWVDGAPLNTWVDQNIGQPEKLKDAAAQWRKVVNDMRKNNLAHGDYQHGNIMVTPKDELRLVDYDGMYCPAFGKGRSPELGHINFQHPRRLPEHYDDTLDNFSALVIYMSLLALADDPTLWKEFYTGDNLILVSADFKNPQNSKAFTRLQASKNPVVKQLAALIRDCAMRSVSDVPWFEDAVVAAEKGTLEAEIAAKPEPMSAASWLDDAAAADEMEGAIGTPNVSRPSPPPATKPAVSRPTPAKTASKPVPAAASAPEGPYGTRVSPPTPLPKPATKPSPQATTPQRQTQAPTPYEEPKSGSMKLVLIVTAVIVVGVIIFLIVRK